MWVEMLQQQVITNINSFCWRKKCLRHLIDKIKRNDHRIGTCEFNKVSCFDDKIYIQNNGCHGLALGYSC